MRRITLLAGLVAAFALWPVAVLAQDDPEPAEEVDDAAVVDDEGGDEAVAEDEAEEGDEAVAEDEAEGGDEAEGEAEAEEEVEGEEAEGDTPPPPPSSDEEGAGKAAGDKKSAGAATPPSDEKGAGKAAGDKKSAGAADPASDEKGAGKAASDKKSTGAVILAKKRKHFTAIGAAPIDREDTALRVAVGYPEFQALYHMPFDRDLEWAVGGGVFYGLNAQTAGDITGGMVLAEGRWRFFHDQDHSIALTAAPALMLGADTKRNVLGGLVLDFPGVTYDYEIKGEHHAVLGFHIPWGIFVSREGTGARIPFVFKMGMEFAVSQAVHVFVTSELGVDVWAGKLPDEILSRSAYLFARGLAGAAFTL